MKYLSGITKNLRVLLILKEQKEYALQIMVVERMKSQNLQLFLELQVLVNYTHLLLLYLVENIQE